MKSTTKVVIAAISALIIGATSTAYAMKDGGHKGHHKKQSILKMADELALTDTQKESIQLLEAQFKADKTAMRESNQDADRETKREAKRALRDSFKAQVNDILTDEQEAKLEELKKNRKGKKHRHSDS